MSCDLLGDVDVADAQHIRNTEHTCQRERVWLCESVQRYRARVRPRQRGGGGGGGDKNKMQEREREARESEEVSLVTLEYARGKRVASAAL